VALIACIVVVLASFAFILQPSGLHPAPPKNGFSIIQITDTQYLPQSYPTLYDNLTHWIVANNKFWNVSMVIHTGDIVNVPDDKVQWQNANDAMMTLYKAGIPYCWCAGNHDLVGDLVGREPNNYTYLGSNYPAFNPDHMSDKSYWVDSIYHGTSTAVKFRFGNIHFAVVDVAYNANQTVLDWMQNIIHMNPDVNVIVATHNFLNGYAKYGSHSSNSNQYHNSTIDQTWATNFQRIISGDSNVFMTLNGHDAGTGVSACLSQEYGQTEIFFNCQELYNQQGSVFARIYTFNMANAEFPKVNVNTVAGANIANSSIHYGEYMTSVGEEPARFSFNPYLLKA